MTQMKSPREALGEALIEVAEKDERVVTLSADSYGGSGSDWASSAFQKREGEVVVAGYTNSTGSGFFDLLLLRIPNQ